MWWKRLITAGITSLVLGSAGVYADLGDLASLVAVVALFAGLLCTLAGFACFLCRTPTTDELQRQNPENDATWHFSGFGVLTLGVSLLAWGGVKLVLDRSVPALQQEFGRRTISGLIAFIITAIPAAWVFRKVPLWHSAPEPDHESISHAGDTSEKKATDD